MGCGHIGVFRETFRVAPRAYETIYINMHPTLLGATNIQIKDKETGEGVWVPPLVDADVLALRSQFSRMGLVNQETV
jgi:hypothetical protein